MFRLRTPKSRARALVAALGLLLAATSARGQTSSATGRASAPTLREPIGLGTLLGRPIRRVEVIQTPGRWTSPATPTSVRFGEALTAATARRAAQELLATGGFASMTLEAAEEGDGAVLRLIAEPRRLIASRRMRGSPIDEAEAWREAGAAQGEELTEARLGAIEAGARRAHVARGYPNARVRVDTLDTDDRMRVVLLVEVTAGAPRIVARRTTTLSDAAHTELEELLGDYAVAQGDRADEVALQAADENLAEQIRGRGFPKATVTHRTLEANGATHLQVSVASGPKLRLHFEGIEHFDGDQLQAVLDYDRETDRNGSHLADKVRAFYRSVGFLDASVEVEERGAAGDAVNALVFRVHEGNAVTVAAREYPCLAGGTRTAAGLTSEIDSFLEEELPGADLLGTVEPSRVDALLGPTSGTGTRAAPYEPEPTRVFVQDVYDKALKHVQDLYRSEGYLSASVGPVQVIRRTCDPRSPPGRCVVRPMGTSVADACTVDARGVPRDDPPTEPRLTCHPDVRRGIGCEPQVWLRIPVKLGPATTLHDVVFEGNRAATEQSLLDVAELKLGVPASNLELEQGRRKIVQAYRELGFAYAEVRGTLDLSPDRSRARARFTINESQQVIVGEIVVTGATATSEALIRGRIALRVGEPYRQSALRKTEERIATLGTFSSVSVALRDPYVPAQRKTVVVHVQERLPQYLDIRPGFSTGEGIRAQIEYGHLNIAGEAIQLTLRLRLSYLPDPFVLDSQVRTNLAGLPIAERLERHNTLSVLFPEVGLGPMISLGFDGVDVRSNARDYGLTKDALWSSIAYRPSRAFTVSIGTSFERNDVQIFGGESVIQYLQRPGVTTDLRRLLLAPDGLTYAIAQRLSASWDRRDNPLGATRGTLVGGTAEHVRAFRGEDNPNTITSDFLRMTGVMTGYVRLTKRGMTFAASVRAGRAVQLSSDSKTYPDRLFFLGGIDTIRGFLPDSVVPQDVAEKIAKDASLPNDDPAKLTVGQVAIRGGDVFVNPRTELRIPLTSLVQTTVFLDMGNVWVEPQNFAPWKLRYAAGTGIRVGTPIGPIAFDYGINLDRRVWEDFGAFHFSIGLF